VAGQVIQQLRLGTAASTQESLWSAGGTREELPQRVLKESNVVVDEVPPIESVFLHQAREGQLFVDLSQVQHQIVVQRNAATRFGLAHEQLIGGVVLTVDDGYVDDHVDHIATQFIRVVHGL
jgi:hypothetical protein